MDSSTRLYARLAEIPQDPNDPDSLDDLLVCAFGAFERYYLCWKTKGGEFRHDGYDLPPALKDWLYPTDGSTRDFATLQVVFGRGEEYFASDKNGKLEFKEPAVKKPADEDTKDTNDTKAERQALRRSRTVSILRPLSEVSVRPESLRSDSVRPETTRFDSVRSESAASDTPVANRRTLSVSSLRASRPPSLSYSTTGSDTISLHSVAESQDIDAFPPLESSIISHWDQSPEHENTDASPSKTEGKLWGFLSGASTKPKPAVPAAVTPAQTTGQPLHTRYNSRSAIATIPEGEQTASVDAPLTSHGKCACGLEGSEPSKQQRPSYADASMQTDPITPSLRTPLRIDSFAASNWGMPNYTLISNEAQTPIYDNYAFGRSSFMGMGMMDYFNKPGYQLGDGLASRYHYEEQSVYYEQPASYEYQDEFGPEALR